MDGKRLADTIEQLLLDSKTICLVFSRLVTDEEKDATVARIAQMYREIGGLGIAAQALDDERTNIRIKPFDDPANNVIY